MKKSNEKKSALKESWKKWMPIDVLEKNYKFESINEDGELSVVISNYNHNVEIVFTGTIYGFRRIHKKNSTKPDLQWSFYTVENSTFLNWIIQESLNSCKSKTLTQFSILTNQFIIEIIVDNPLKTNVLVHKKSIL